MENGSDVITDVTLAGADEKAGSFIDGLPEELKSGGTFEGIENPEQLARHYLKLKGKADGAPVPPESADDYDVPVDEGLPVDPDFIGGFRAAAHQAGLSQRQVAALAEWYNGQTRGAIETRKAAGMSQVRDSETALRKEWGPGYQQNLDLARRAFKQNADPELVEYFDSTGLSNDARLVRMFHRIGKAVSEDVLVRGGTSPEGIERTPGGIPMLHFPSMDK